MYSYRRALNLAMNHMYFNLIAKNRLKDNDASFRERVSQQQDKIRRVERRLTRGRLTDRQQKQENEAFKKAQNKLNTIYRFYNKKARETYEGAIALSKQSDVANVIKKQFPELSRNSGVYCL